MLINWLAMQELMERAVVLTQGGGQPQASPALGDLVAQYSTILASQVGIYLCMAIQPSFACMPYPAALLTSHSANP